MDTDMDLHWMVSPRTRRTLVVCSPLCSISFCCITALAWAWSGTTDKTTPPQSVPLSIVLIRIGTPPICTLTLVLPFKIQITETNFTTTRTLKFHFLPVKEDSSKQSLVTTQGLVISHFQELSTLTFFRKKS